MEIGKYYKQRLGFWLYSFSRPTVGSLFCKQLISKYLRPLSQGLCHKTIRPYGLCHNYSTVTHEWA